MKDKGPIYGRRSCAGFYSKEYEGCLTCEDKEECKTYDYHKEHRKKFYPELFENEDGAQ